MQKQSIKPSYVGITHKRGITKWNGKLTTANHPNRKEENQDQKKKKRKHINHEIVYFF